MAKTAKGRGGSRVDTRLKDQGVCTRLCEGQQACVAEAEGVGKKGVARGGKGRCRTRIWL